MYVLNLKTKMIHSKKRAKAICRLADLAPDQKVEVQGLNWSDIDRQGWRFCKGCFERVPKRSH